jgi:DNA-binding response OmpR family regulator
MTRTVLIVDDDTNVRALLTLHLSEQGYKVTEAGDGERGLTLALSGSYDLVLLDVSLPGKDGLSICREVRSQGVGVPIMMLTNRGDEIDRVLGLELGADDYVAKPFSIREVLARAKALLRRTSDSVAPVVQQLQFGPLAIDSASREVTLSGEALSLTSTEFDLLFFMVRNAGRAFSREQLLAGVWGYTSSSYEHTVNVTINRLRNKIERNPASPEFIQTVWGVGYKFVGSSHGVQQAA